jgi:hypothetical protein
MTAKKPVKTSPNERLELVLILRCATVSSFVDMKSPQTTGHQLFAMGPSCPSEFWQFPGRASHTVPEIELHSKCGITLSQKRKAAMIITVCNTASKRIGRNYDLQRESLNMDPAGALVRTFMAHSAPGCEDSNAWESAQQKALSNLDRRDSREANVAASRGDVSWLIEGEPRPTVDFPMMISLTECECLRHVFRQAI